MSFARSTLAVVLMGVASIFCAPAVQAQGSACTEYRAELAMLDRAAAGRGPAPGEIERLQHAWQQMGCARSMPFFNAPSGACDSLEQRIAHLQRGPQLSRGSAVRHAELSRLVGTFCQDAPRQREARGSSIQIDQGDALSANSFDRPLPVVPETPLVVEETKPQIPPPVNATCVRLCDGFPFPLSVSPGGREGADQMCQALCPGAPSKAFFKNGGALSAATDSGGRKYSALTTAGLYQKQLDPACSCKPQDQSWKSALRRAGELAGRESTDTVVQDEPLKRSDLSTLRGSASAETRPGKRISNTSIDPVDEPLPLEKTPSGIVHLTPIEPQRKFTPRPEIAPAEADIKKEVRVVAPRPDANTIPLLADPRKPQVKGQ